jgi:hypothetical protein
MPVPWDGGWSPTTWFVPTVTSASGLALSTPAPTTPPLSPFPAETDAPTSDISSGGCRVGAGAEASPPPVPPAWEAEPEPEAEPALPDAASGPADAEPPDTEPDLRAGAVTEVPTGVAPPAGRGPSADPPGVALLAAAAAPVELDGTDAAGPEPAPPPEPEAEPGPVTVEDGAPGAEATRPTWPPSPMREMAMPLARSTSSADETASHTYALLRCATANQVLPEIPSRCQQAERNTGLEPRSLSRI